MPRRVDRRHRRYVTAGSENLRLYDIFLNIDYVRLHAGLAPPHWRRNGGDRWDAGYDTTGYFLDWVEERYHAGIVKQLNAAMNEVEYDELIFKTATGLPVEELWKLYCAQLKDRLPSESPGNFDVGCFRITLISSCKALRGRIRRKPVIPKND